MNEETRKKNLLSGLRSYLGLGGAKKSFPPFKTRLAFTYNLRLPQMAEPSGGAAFEFWEDSWWNTNLEGSGKVDAWEEFRR